MPTAVSAARQCLAPEAAAALDEAVAVARRRSHAQTTSLHVVSALLSLPSSSSSLLRDALSRARSANYSPRLQFKALEICFFVALDRLPSSAADAPTPDDPPVSNSLMAAIKRSQANQRRHPETFHLYHHHNNLNSHHESSPPSASSSSSFSGLKVELQQLVLSILDDPVVSRVFADAGFRSCDVKVAVLRPPPSSILRFPRCPPLFLCSFSSDVGPYSYSSSASEENCRRIGEALLGGRGGRNPVLVGAGAADALGDFAELVASGRWGLLPRELAGIRMFQIRGADRDRDRGWAGRVRGEVEGGVGVVVSVGDLGALVEEDGEEEWVVGEVTRVLGEYAGRVWVLGCSATYETYMKFLARYPSVDKDWDLQLLPITSVKPPCSLTKSSSFMESFVPFGGFFPVAPALPSFLPSPKLHQQAFRCHHCNEEYDREVFAMLKENSEMVADMQKANLASQKRNVELTTLGNNDLTKASDRGTTLNEKIANLQKKWNDICQHLHYGGSTLGSDAYSSQYEAFPRIVGFPVTTDNRGLLSQNNGNGLGEYLDKFPVGMSVGTCSTTKPSSTLSVLSELSNVPSLQDQKGQLPEGEMNKGHFSRSSSCADLVAQIDLTSSAASVSTDLVLGSISISPSKERSPTPRKAMSQLDGVSQNIPVQEPRVVNASFPVSPAQSSLHHSWPSSRRVNSTLGMPNTTSQAPNAGASKLDRQCLSSSSISLEFDFKDFKALHRSLMEKVHGQEEAIRDISEAITWCKTGHARCRGIWLNFIGPDRIGKKKIAMALAELVFGDKRKLIHVDLGVHDGDSKPTIICDELGFICNGNFRGKVAVDHIFMEINNKPWSVVFLENIDRADILVQSSLSQAIKMGRFPDSHGREISSTNAIFITTAKEVKDNTVSSKVDSVNYCEERILAAQKWQLEILIESAYNPLSLYPNLCLSNVSWNDSSDAMQSPCSVYVNKRKLCGNRDSEGPRKSSDSAKRAHKALDTVLDLNVPFEETTASGGENGSMESNVTSSENSTVWLEEFFGLVDKNVLFKQFDFDILADYITKEISKCFRNSVGSDCQLEIDAKAMEQMLAATWLLNDTGALNNWLQQVLVVGFVEARERYNLSSHTALRLVPCEDSAMEEEAPGIRLPSKVIVR